MRGSLSGNFVRKTGDTMTGLLTIQTTTPQIRLIDTLNNNCRIEVWDNLGNHPADWMFDLIGDEFMLYDRLGALARVRWARTTGKQSAGIDPLARQPHAQGNPDEIMYWEDFFGGLLSNGNIGDTGWGVSLVGSGALLQSASEANHTGTRQLSTGATINSFVSLFPNTNTINLLLGSDVFDLLWLFRQVSSDANIGINVGMQGSTGSQNPSDGIYLQKLPGDVNYFFVCRAGGVQTRSDSLIAADANWHSIRMKDNGAGNVLFTIDESISTNIPTNRTNQFISPMAVVTNTIAATRDLIVDACGLYMPLVR